MAGVWGERKGVVGDEVRERLNNGYFEKPLRSFR